MLIVSSGLLAAAVVQPLTRPGWLLLLDWMAGPHPELTRGFWGLDRAGLTSMPAALALLGLQHTLGPATAAWLPAAAFFPIAGVGAARLGGGRLPARAGAGLLYALTPIVYERFWVGQFFYLLAYAVLPWAARSLLLAASGARRERLRSALWVALLVALTPHFLWIAAVLVAAVVLEGRARPRVVGWVAAVVVGAAIVTAYVPLATAGRPGATEVSGQDLSAYRTRADPDLGLLANVAGLYGFWRQEPPLPKDDVPGWPFLLAAMLLVAARGAHAGWRDPHRRRLVTVVSSAGVVGLVLALGDQGPTGGVFRWMFFRVPGFAIMREPQKFAVLVALAYAVLFGLGVDALASSSRRGWRRSASLVVPLLLPFLYTPSLVAGLHGRLQLSHYPQSWAAADRLMGDGDGKALFLPWHQYLSFPFTGRVVANPADVAFRRDVIVGDNVELPNLPTASRSTRSAYLEFLYANGDGLCGFGDLISPLGVEFVLLARTVDWEDYRWLDRQVDLVKVLDAPELVVYRNLHFAGLGWRAGATRQASDWGEVVEASGQGGLSGNAVVVQHQAPGPRPVNQVGCQAPSARQRSDVVVRRSPVAYRVGSGPPGTVVLSEPFDPTWRMGGHRPVELVGGVTGVPAGPEQGTVRFGHWERVRVGYGISLCAFALLLTMSGLSARTGHTRRI